MLSFLLGPKGFANWLVRNKWKNIVEIRKLTGLPLLLLSALQVSFQLPSASWSYTMRRKTYQSASKSHAEVPHYLIMWQVLLWCP